MYRFMYHLICCLIDHLIYRLVDHLIYRLINHLIYCNKSSHISSNGSSSIASNIQSHILVSSNILTYHSVSSTVSQLTGKSPFGTCVFSHVESFAFFFFPRGDDTMWGPAVISWFISPSNYIVISTINHSYWSYKPTYLSWGPHIAGVPRIRRLEGSHVHRRFRSPLV